MYKQLFLIIPFENFEKLLDEKIIESKVLSNTDITSSEELESYKIKNKIWTEGVLDILKNSFNEPNNNYLYDFQSASGNFFSISGTKKTLKQLADKQKDALKSKQMSITGIIKLISVSDAVAKREKTDLIARANYKTQDKLDLLLKKLYEIYDDFYYPIETILEGNGIYLKRHGEDRELINILENNGYVEQLGGTGGINARLTASGAMYIDEKQKTFKENYDDINKSQEEINTRVDEVLERLTKLGFGQEILFEELQELKELYSKVSKKTWGQVLKGKLIALALAKFIEKDTLDFIYHSLTNHNIRLP